MAVTFDAASTDTVAAATSLTFAHTTSGSDRMLFLALHSDPYRTITSVTYGGATMTAVETSNVYMRLYGLVAPATGTNNVVVTNSGSGDICAVAASYNGVDQSTPYDGTQVSATGGASPSVTVTSATDNLVVGMSANLDGVGQAVQTAGAGQTSRGSLTVAANYIILSDEAGAASVTHSYGRSGSFYYDQLTVAVNVIASGGAPAAATHAFTISRALG